MLRKYNTKPSFKAQPDGRYPKTRASQAYGKPPRARRSAVALSQQRRMPNAQNNVNLLRALAAAWHTPTNLRIRGSKGVPRTS